MIAWPSKASAQAFEPTDLELEKPGVLDIDVQVGPTYGAGAWGRRWFVTDLELDLGIYKNVELDLDAAFSSDLQPGGSRVAASEALWPSVKLGLFGARVEKSAIAVGVQLGPRIPVLTGAGLGYAALGLVGWSLGRVHLAFNGGFLTDPGLAIAYGHPTGAVLGIDAVVAIDSRGHYALTSEIGGTALGDGRGEAHQTIGFAWEPFPDRLQFSVVFLTGISPSPDRGALLFGMSPKVNLW